MPYGEATDAQTRAATRTAFIDTHLGREPAPPVTEVAATPTQTPTPVSAPRATLESKSRIAPTAESTDQARANLATQRSRCRREERRAATPSLSAASRRTLETSTDGVTPLDRAHPRDFRSTSTTRCGRSTRRIRNAEQRPDDWLRAEHPSVAAAWPIPAMRELRDAMSRERPDLSHDFTAQRLLTLERAFAACGMGGEHVDAAFEVYYAARNAVECYPDTLLARLAGASPRACR